MKKYIFLVLTIISSLIMGVFYIDSFIKVDFVMNNRNIIPLILLITLGVLISYIFYDLGHLLFTKLGKYKVISFRILNSHFYIKDNKIHQCNSLYKDHYHPIVIGSETENNHYNLYYLGGCLMNLIVGIIVYISLIFVKNDTLFTLVFIAFGFVNIVYAIINALPLSFLYNDGYFLYNLLRQKASTQAFHSKNALIYRIYNGKDFGDLNFSVYNIDNLNNDYNDPIILEFKELEAYHYMYKLQFNDSLNTIDYVLSKSNHMLSLYKKTYTNLKLINLILLERFDDATTFYLSLNEKQKTSITKCKTLDDTLLSLLIHKYIDKNKIKYDDDKDVLNSYILNTNFKGEVKALQDLLNYIDTKKSFD